MKKILTVDIVKDWLDDENVVDLCIVSKSVPLMIYNQKVDGKNDFIEIKFNDYELVTPEVFDEINKFLEDRFRFKLNDKDHMVLKHQKTDKYLEKMTLLTPNFCLNGYSFSYRKSISMYM